jgi:hypothetical protein
LDDDHICFTSHRAVDHHSVLRSIITPARLHINERMREEISMRIAIRTGARLLRFKRSVIGTGLMLGADATVKERGFGSDGYHGRSVERFALYCQSHFDEAPSSNLGTPTI